MSWLVAADVGGTFTDVIAMGGGGETRVVKVPSRPDCPAEAFRDAALRLSAEGVDLEDASLLFYGTTIATNALLTGDLARVTLACTAGFKDIMTYRDGRRERIYDLMEPSHREWVREDDRIEVVERLSAEGKPIEPLTDEAVERAVSEIAARHPEAVAIAFLFSYVDDLHERMLAEAVGKRLGVPVTTSASVAREMREYPRTATTVLNAALAPVIDKALTQVRSALTATGATAPLLVMQSNGGCVPSARAPMESHRLVLSGPAGGVAGALALGAAYGIDQLISLDMGGTSLDVCLVSDGKPPLRPTRVIDGYQVLCPSVDVVAVGAGGGSIARVDRAGRLRLGPESAGAHPGPAAYGLGGTSATVTDAHVVCGSLPVSLRLGDTIDLDVDAAAAVLDELGAGLGLSRAKAAAGVVELAVVQMVGAVRRVSVEQGIDPRGYSLVAFGGAGPLHAGLLLRAFGTRSVLVPRYPGLFAASGLLASDLRIDESQTVLTHLVPAVLEELAAWFESTGRVLTARLRSDGIPAGRVRLSASADCRFVGQGYELEVPIGRVTRRSLASMSKRFCDLHRATYGHADTSQEVEVVALRLSAFGHMRRAEASPLAGGRAIPRRQAVIGTTTLGAPFLERRGRAPIYDRRELLANNRIEGPAVIHQLDSTIVLLAGQGARVDARGTIFIEEAAR
jgi:N-methylhydantoinase A